MTKRRKERTVMLTTEQRRRLERLWFYYGSYGPQTTPGNHSFIQGFLEHGIDTRSFRTKRTPKSEIPTPECEEAVEAVLAMRSDTVPGNEGAGAGVLRLISSAPKRIPTELDSEMKAILDDMKGRSLIRHELLKGDGDTPEAA